MSRTEHPELENLAALVQEPDAVEHAALRTHLTQCAYCRQKAARMASLQDHVVKYIPRIQGNSAMQVSAETVADWVDGRVPAAQHEDVLRQIHADPVALKAALHYATHTAERTPAAARVAAESKANATSLWPRWLGMRMSWTVPVWLGAPVAAAMVVAILLTYMSGGQPRVVPYQDDPYLVWQPQPFGAQAASGPGLGFFNSAEQKKEAAKKIHFGLQAQRLRVQWDAVPGARNYSLHVSWRDESGETQSMAVSAIQPQAVIEPFAARPGMRYEWVLQGEDSQGLYFQMQGGFVVSEAK